LARPAAEARQVAGLTIASFWRRLAGFAVDLVVLGVVLMALSVMLGLSPVLSTTDYIISVLFQVAYYWLWNSIGWSPGKRVVGLRIVSEEGDRPGAERGFARTVISVVGQLALFIGYLWALWDARTQTWHDKMAGTYVVVAPSRDDGRTGAGPRRPVG
jgi:uncharacterized RDD family membrane protein YckC